MQEDRGSGSEIKRRRADGGGGWTRTQASPIPECYEREGLMTSDVGWEAWSLLSRERRGKRKRADPVTRLCRRGSATIEEGEAAREKRRRREMRELTSEAAGSWCSQRRRGGEEMWMRRFSVLG